MVAGKSFSKPQVSKAFSERPKIKFKLTISGPRLIWAPLAISFSGLSVFREAVEYDYGGTSVR
jgi:hypothetical protein